MQIKIRAPIWTWEFGMTSPMGGISLMYPEHNQIYLWQTGAEYTYYTNYTTEYSFLHHWLWVAITWIYKDWMNIKTLKLGGMGSILQMIY